jgi:hypothetical protein
LVSDLSWTNTSVRLGDLKPWPRNPKTISKRNAERLLASWNEMGQFQTVAIGPDGEVYDGHQRLSVLLAARGAEYMIDARQSNRALTEDERAKLVLSAHVGTTGAWNWDALSGWDESLLQDCGFDAALLKELNDDAANLNEMLRSMAGESDDEPYSRKIEAPIYEPTGEKPEVSALYDDSKTKALTAAIDASALDDEIKQFLTIAAQRHTVLNFARIAEFYAHADEDLQALMEDSALVIIDFNRAIELGFVQLTERIAEMVRDEYGE